MEPGAAGHQAHTGTVRGNGEAVCRQRFDEIEEEVRTAAYKIIEAKSATYYGIGMALTRITKAILGDEHSVLTVSAMLRGEYGQMDVFAGVPCIINQNGVQRVLPLSLTPEELEKLGRSCDTLREGMTVFSDIWKRVD